MCGISSKLLITSSSKRPAPGKVKRRKLSADHAKAWTLRRGFISRVLFIKTAFQLRLCDPPQTDLRLNIGSAVFYLKKMIFLADIFNFNALRFNRNTKTAAKPRLCDPPQADLRLNIGSAVFYLKKMIFLADIFNFNALRFNRNTKTAAKPRLCDPPQADLRLNLNPWRKLKTKFQPKSSQHASTFTKSLVPDYLNQSMRKFYVMSL
jgi:hypothetical protein